MTTGLQKLCVPPMGRLALADMAQRRGRLEEEVLADIIRDAVKRELSAPDARPAACAEVRR
jgi:hypothetical protein